MTYTVERIEKSIAYCGLVCILCNEGKSGRCTGCMEKCDGCSIKACSQDKKIDGCWECKEFPCDKEMFKNKRNRAFVQCAKEEGVYKLAEYLKKNYDNGISYHKEDGTKGDYDILDDEEKILLLLRKKESSFEKCPIYESKQFVFRLVEENDAKDLLKCYSDPASARVFNSDNCTSNFIFKSLEEMENCIRFWLNEYKNQCYVRFSIIDKIRGKAVGTIEIFAKKCEFAEIGKVGILRLDLASQYEKEELIGEIVDVINDNFYDDFEVENIITKAIPETKQRICALKNRGFMKLQSNTILPYDYYFMRTK